MAIRRVRVHGRRVWQARVAFQGHRKSRVCPSKEAARQAEADLLQALKVKASQEAAEHEQPATLKAVFEAYVADLEAREKGPDTISRAAQTAVVFEKFLPELLERPVSEVGEAEIFAFRRVRDRAGTKPSTINRDLRTIRAMLRRVRPEFRFPKGAFFSEDETRVRWLRPEEEILVFEPMRPPFREMAKLAAMTLMRLSEVRLLRREMIHLEQGVVLLPRAKAGARPVVLSAAAQKLLRHRLEHHGSAWVFPGPDDRPYSRFYVGEVFRHAARAAGLRDFTFHDLRHHGATMALNAGFSAPIVMKLGGWKTERMMRRYAAVTDQTLRRAAEAVSGNEVGLAGREVGLASR